MQVTSHNIVEVSDRGILALIGPDGQDLLQRLSTNDLSNLQIGEVVSTVLTNEKGRIADVLAVIKESEDRLFLVGHSTNPNEVAAWIEKFIIMENARIEQMQPMFAHFLLLDGAQDVDPSQEMRLLNVLQTDFSALNLPHPGSGFWFIEDWGNTRLCHLIVNIDRRDDFVEQLRNTGRSLSPLEEYDRYRIRRGIPEWPNELTTDFNPLEAQLLPLISFTKGCYIGQEVIARLDTYQKVRKILVRFELDEAPITLPAAVRDGKEEVGFVTSCVREKDSKIVLGLGFLKREAIEDKRNLSVVSSGREIVVHVLNDDQLETKERAWKHS